MSANRKRRAAEEIQAELAVVAEETLRTFGIVGKHLEEMGRAAGGGFEPAWYNRLFNQIKFELQPFTEG